MEMRNIKNKIKEISKLFICNICNKQFTQPIICFHCEKLYCLNCINHLLNSNCPNCNYKINEENFKPIKIFEEIKIDYIIFTMDIMFIYVNMIYIFFINYFFS